MIDGSIKLNEKIGYGFIFTYLIILAIAEYNIAYSSIIFGYNSTQIGIIMHILLLFFFIFLSGLAKDKKNIIFLQALSLVSLLRIISVSIPLFVALEPIERFSIIYVPLLLSGILFLNAHEIKKKDVGYIFKNFQSQIIIAFTGIFFGIIEYSILKEYVSLETVDFFKFLIFMFVLIIFTGFVEELIFRGILFSNMLKIFSVKKSIIITSLIFAILHLGWHSFIDLILVFFVSIFYCYVFFKTKNIIGISLSHGITNVFVFLIMPLMYI